MLMLLCGDRLAAPHSDRSFFGGYTLHILYNTKSSFGVATINSGLMKIPESWQETTSDTEFLAPSVSLLPKDVVINWEKMPSAL
jgi:hypothetical protein